MIYLSRNNLLMAVLMALAMSACKMAPQENTIVFFNLDSLIDQQVANLSRIQPVLEKEAEINGEQETLRLEQTDSMVWAKELDIFRQLDLNTRALNAGRYEIETGLRDDTSNLSIIEYTAKEELPLSHVRIYYQENPRKVRRIEGSFRSKKSNRLYASSRELSMELIDINSKAMLTQYQVTGGQKMIMGDSISYRIVGALTYE